MSRQQNTYADFKEKQSELAALLEEASEAIAPIDLLAKDANSLKSLAEKVNKDSFKLMVVGDFKNGKSTFINSFLGEAVLPAQNLPCTAVISEVRYGEKREAKLYFKSTLSDLAKDFIAKSDAKQEVKELVKKHGGKGVPPIKIPADEIKKYATIPTDKTQKEMAQESPYEKIELFWDLELLKNNIELVDSPGLNEAETREAVTMQYLDKADAILFVVSARKVGSDSENKFIKLHLKDRFNHIYFIFNQWDLVDTEEDRRDTMKSAKETFCEFTDFGESGIYFVSARNALIGKTQKKPDLLKSSGMPEFEKELENFLTNDRGRVKLSQPAKELRRILDTKALKEAFPQVWGMLDTSLADMKARRDEAMPKLARIKKRQTATWDNIHKQLEMAEREFRTLIEKFLTDFRNNIAVWINEFEPMASDEDMQSVVNEISDHVKNQVEIEQKEWQDNTLRVFIQGKIQYIRESNSSALEDFFQDLKEVKGTISGVKALEEENVPLDLKLQAVSVGFSDIDLSSMSFESAVANSGAGFKIKNLLLPVGLAVAGGMFLGPIGAFLGGAIGSFFRGSSGGSAKIGIEQVRAQLIEKIQDQVINSGLDSFEKMIEDLQNQLWKYFESILKGMDAEAEGVEVQVNRVIEEMEQGQQEVQHQKSVLAALEERVRQIKAKADKFIAENIDGR